MADVSKRTYAPAAFSTDEYSVSRSTWWRVARSLGFLMPVCFGRAVRWDVEKVAACLAGGNK